MKKGIKFVKNKKIKIRKNTTHLYMKRHVKDPKMA
jgi:hypothetical protein